MATDISIIELVLKASLVVQLVMGLLGLVSVYSWTIILYKRSILKRARRNLLQFERRFWSGADLSELYKKLSTSGGPLSGMEAIFEAGFREFIHLRKQAGLDAMAVVEGAQRAMRVALNREYETLESHLSFLATVGSTSPYIGLFGTVWGIMNSFRSLGASATASISDVAPGIAEALVATAIGLFAAIPAVIAYNRFANDLERVMGLARHFGIPTSVCVNKWDVNPDAAKRIEDAAEQAGATLAGRVPYDRAFTEAMIRGLALVEHESNGAADALRAVWDAVTQGLARADRADPEQ